MWIHEYPPKIIVRESGIYQDTLTGLTYHWREIMELENENQESIHGLMGKNSGLVETEECAITGKRKAKRG